MRTSLKAWLLAGVSHPAMAFANRAWMPLLPLDKPMPAGEFGAALARVMAPMRGIAARRHRVSPVTQR